MTGQPWRLSWRADPAAAALADRHYNRQSIGAAQFVPPGRCHVLVAGDPVDAVWVTSWPLPQYVGHRWPGAWTNTLFRNECPLLSSTLILAAVAATRARWPDVPDLGMITTIDVDQVRHKRDPGRCYRRAGFVPVGRTLERDLLVLQLTPDLMPDPSPAVGSQATLL